MKEQPTNSKNNTELCAKDMSAATRQEKIDWLMQIVDNELDRGEDRDEQLIWECMETLEQLSEQLAAIPSTAPKAERKTFHTPRSQRIKKGILRISALAAVIAMAISLPIYAHAQTLVRRDQQMLSDAMSYAQAMEKLETDPSETIDPSEIIVPPESPTASAHTQTIYFRMTDLFWDYPTLDFYYPRQNSKVPDHFRTDIKQAAITYESDESWVVVLSFDNPSLKSFVVQRQVSAAKYTPPSKDPTVIRAQYRSYAVSEITTEDGTLYETGFSHMGLSYTVQALDMETLRLALNSMWGVKETYQTIAEMEHDWKHLWGFRLPDMVPYKYTLTRITVSHQSNAEWEIDFEFQSEEGYSVTCYVRRTWDGRVMSSHYDYNAPNIAWIPYRYYRAETE